MRPNSPSPEGFSLGARLTMAPTCLSTQSCHGLLWAGETHASGFETC